MSESPPVAGQVGRGGGRTRRHPLVGAVDQAEDDLHDDEPPEADDDGRHLVGQDRPDPHPQDGEQGEDQDEAGGHGRDLVDESRERATPGRQGEPAPDQGDDQHEHAQQVHRGWPR